MTASIYLVHPSEVGPHWELALPFVNKALERQTDYDEIAVYRNLILGEMRLWLVFFPPKDVRAAVITKMVQFPLTKACLIFALGGEGMEEWLHLLTEAVEPWAKSQGCTHMELKGRPGWERALDYRKTAVVLRKEI